MDMLVIGLEIIKQKRNCREREQYDYGKRNSSLFHKAPPRMDLFENGTWTRLWI